MSGMPHPEERSAMPARLLISLLGIIFLLSCSKSTGPGDDTSQGTLASRTIGSEGGTLDGGEASVIIPSGALASARTVSLGLSEEQYQSESIISKTYTLSGVPSGAAKPAELRVKYSGALSEESYIILVSTDTENEQTSSLSFQYLPAADSSGYLAASMPTALQAKLSRHKSTEDLFGEYLIMYFFAVSSYKSIQSSNGHFTIKYPHKARDLAPVIGTYLEETYSVFKATGFDFSSAGGYAGSLDYVLVHIEDFLKADEPLAHHHYEPNHSSNDDYSTFNIDLNEKRLRTGSADEIRAAAGSEFMGLLFYASDPGRAYTLDWFLEAAKLWAQGLIVTTAGYVPSGFSGNEAAPFQGLLKGITPPWENVRAYGRGMAPLLKYLCADNRYGKGLMQKVFEKIRGGKKTVEALSDAIEDYPRVWWPGFLKEYLSGNIYPVPSGTIFSGPDGEFTIASARDTLKTFTKNYTGLSAGRYRVNLVYTDLNEASTLTFSSDRDYAPVLVFGVKNASLEYYGQGTEITINNIRDMVRSGYDLFAVVANSRVSADYTETTPVTLKVKVNQGPPVSLDKYTRCYIGLAYVNCHFSNGDEWSVDTYSWEARGHFDGNSFTAISDTTISSVRHTTTITINLNENLSSIADFSAEYTSVFTTTAYTRRLSGRDLPIQTDDPYTEALIFRANGTDVKKYFTLFHITAGVFNELIEYTCDENTYFWITIYPDSARPATIPAEGKSARR